MKKQYIRSFLLILAFMGLGLGVFWDFFLDALSLYNFLDPKASPCPFASSKLTKQLHALPPLETRFVHRTSESCDLCVTFQDKVYFLGFAIDSMQAQSTLTFIEDISAMFSSSLVSKHATKATQQLMDAKFPQVIVGKD